MNNLDLTVIVLSYNTKEITLKCLSKLKIAKDYCEKRFGNKVEVIVVDNASTDGSAGAIKSGFPWIKLTASDVNLGFSKGNNIAMENSKSPFILLMNSDVYVQEESIYKALAYFRVNLNCDVLGPRLNYHTGDLQPSSGNLPNPISVMSWILGLGTMPFISNLIPPFHPKDKNYFSKAHQVGWIMGAFFMLKRPIFEKTKGFDENIFMHMEEVEWCKRIKDKGYKIWYAPQIQVIHLHGASTNFDLSSSFLNELKGMRYYLKKHYKYYYYPLKLILVIGLLLRIIAFWTVGMTKRARIYWEGLKVI